MSIRAPFATILAACFALVGIACGDSNQVTTRGLALAGADSRIAGPGGTTVSVPAGAVATDTTIVVSTLPGRRPPTGTASVATPLRLGPAGTTFAHAVEIGVPINPASLPAGKTLDDVVVYRAPQNSSVFVPLPTRRTGPASIAVVTEHFSDFIAVVLDAEAGIPTACGDRFCAANETCTDCPFDCGLCLPSGECGNGPCDVACGYGCTNAATVLDTANGLEWQRYVDTGTYTEAQANTNCGALSLGSWPAGSWRLPTYLEIATLIDTLRVDPTLDTTVFSVPQGALTAVPGFWTSTQAGGGVTGQTWASDLGGTGRLALTSVATALHALCVHGSAPPMALLVDNFDGTVTDQRTGLVWQQTADVNPHNAIDASAFCATVVLGGLPAGSWRAPTALELLGIVQTASGSPAIDPMAFPNTQFDFTYVTTSLAPGGTFWSVDFRDGYADRGSGFTSQHYVRCVR